MKTFLALLLIAFISCAAVEEENLSYCPPCFCNPCPPPPICNCPINPSPYFYLSVFKAIDWIKQNNYWDSLVNKIKTQGNHAGLDYCVKAFDASTCLNIVYFISSP